MHVLHICSSCWAVIRYAHNPEELHENRLVIEMKLCPGGQCKAREPGDAPSWFVPPSKSGRRRLFARVVYSLSENGLTDSRKVEAEQEMKIWLNQKEKGYR